MKFKREEGGSEFPANKNEQKGSLLRKLKIPQLWKWDEVDGVPMEEVDGEMVPSSEVETVEGTDMLGRTVKKRRKKMEFGASPPVRVSGS